MTEELADLVYRYRAEFLLDSSILNIFKSEFYFESLLMHSTRVIARIRLEYLIDVTLRRPINYWQYFARIKSDATSTKIEKCVLISYRLNC